MSYLPLTNFPVSVITILFCPCQSFLSLLMHSNGYHLNIFMKLYSCTHLWMWLISPHYLSFQELLCSFGHAWCHFSLVICCEKVTIEHAVYPQVQSIVYKFPFWADLLIKPYEHRPLLILCKFVCSVSFTIRKKCEIFTTWQLFVLLWRIILHSYTNNCNVDGFGKILTSWRIFFSVEIDFS